MEAGTGEGAGNGQSWNSGQSWLKRLGLGTRQGVQSGLRSLGLVTWEQAVLECNVMPRCLGRLGLVLGRVRILDCRVLQPRLRCTWVRYLGAGNRQSAILAIFAILERKVVES